MGCSCADGRVMFFNQEDVLDYAGFEDE